MGVFGAERERVVVHVLVEEIRVVMARGGDWREERESEEI